MTVVKKIRPALVKPIRQELLSYGIQNEVRKFVGKGKKVIPHIIPFVSSNLMDISDALAYQGINPAAYSAPATQFIVPAGLTVPAGRIKKIPLSTPHDSLFYMQSVKYWAVDTSVNQWPVVAQNATLKSRQFFYDKWNQNSYIGSQAMTHLTLEGTVAAPSEVVTPPASITAFDTKTLHNGMTFILPLYDDDETDPSTADPSSYIQLQIADMAANGSTFNLNTMAGAAYEVKFAGETPVMWPVTHGNNDVGLPYYHFLKAALIANSPHKTQLYGGLGFTPSLDNLLQAHPHVERIYTSTLQGANDGYAQIGTHHLFPLDASISIEIENTFTKDLLVNGYVFGYRIFKRG